MAKDKMIGADDLLAKAMRRVFIEEVQERTLKDREIEVSGALLRRPQSAEKKECPECGHVFQGNGWDGIDAHWRSKHEAIMPYEDAWPLLQEGKYNPLPQPEPK